MTRNSTATRKTPVQERSKDTVRRIIDAATTMLKERGYDGASTNRIAAAAGISPGSLYQYFPNKDAILHAVVEAYTQELLERMARRLSELLQSDPGDLVAAAIEAQVDAMLERPEVLRVISGQLPGHTGADLLKPIEAMMTSTIKGYSVAHQDTPADMDFEAATWVVVQLLGTTVRYVVDEPPIAKDVFVAEMSRLVMSHPIAQGCTLSAAPAGSAPQPTTTRPARAGDQSRHRQSQPRLRIEPQVTSDLQPNTITDVSNVQAYVAGELGARAARNITTAQLEALKDIESALEDAYAANDSERAARLNHEFHRAINIAAASPKLAQLLAQITRDAPHAVYPKIAGWAKRSIIAHNRVMAALEQRDTDGARNAMFDHFAAGVEPLIRHMQQHGLVDNRDTSSRQDSGVPVG